MSPAAVSPGEALAFTACCAGNASTVTSAGLTAPVTLTRVADGHPGTGKAAAEPGSHHASFTCSGNGTVNVTITGSTPTTKPRPGTATRPQTTPKSTAAAPQVKVRPQGAPETGDGTYPG